MAEMKSIRCDLMVIGSGMAGMAAALFAARSGIDTVQVGITGEINFASGLLDVLGVHPVDEGVVLRDPWEGIRQLAADEPRHPYSRLKTEQIRTAMEQFTSFLEEAGLPYHTYGRRNAQVITPVGTLKSTYAVPQSMIAGVHALNKKKPALLVDFLGLKGYSARQIIETLGPGWPNLKQVRIAFPDSRGELFPEHAARAMDTAPAVQKLADAVRPHLDDAEAVGFPAMLGMYRTPSVLSDLEQALGVPVFEIPTMVPGVTGLRLRETFERHLPKMGVTTFYQQKVLEATAKPNGHFEFAVGHPTPAVKVSAQNTILATGRFFGKGLQADRHAIHETLFDLPVMQPEDRRQWHHKDLLHPGGHPINRAGIDINDRFRPVDEHQKIIYPNLHAVGSILAHQDWIRQKCGSGLAIASAYAAVKSINSQ